MIFDIQNCFTSVLSSGVVAQAVTADAVSTNVIDLGLGDIGKGQNPPYLYVKVGPDAFTLLTSLKITLQTSVDSAFTSPIVLPVSQTFLLAALTANAVLMQVALPLGCKRYVRLDFDVTGTNADAGALIAYLVRKVQAE